jgi:hypothetical protein
MSTMSPQQVQMYRFHGEVTYWVLLCVWSVLFCNVTTSNNFSSVFGGMYTWSVISCAQEVGISKSKMPAIIFSIFIQWYQIGNSLIFMLSNALWAREFSKCPSDPPQEGAYFGKSNSLGFTLHIISNGRNVNVYSYLSINWAFFIIDIIWTYLQIKRHLKVYFQVP